ncbi:MAG: LamG domain-containing protein [Rhodocyclaceae bacterium]
MRFVAALFFLLLTGQASAATLLGEYRLEELLWTGAAAEVRDTSGNSRHGQAIGSPLPTPVSTSPARPGRPGTCTYGSFPGPAGNGGALSIGSLPVNTTAGAKTSVSFWMYWNGANSVMPIGWLRHDLWLVNGHFGFNTGNSDVFGISSAGLANRWVHVVAEFTNGNVSANALYIDGVAQILTQRQSTPNNAFSYANATLRVGGWQVNTSYRFSGRIDEVKVYDGQLLPAEVTTLFNETHVCAPRLTLEWRLDECALGTVVGEVSDASGNGNSGTPLGTANTGSGRICKGGIFNGVSPTRIKSVSNFADAITNDFTMAFWVNPTTTHQIDGQSTGGTGGTGGQRYVLYPAQGTDAWGAGHAGVGVSVGTNGVSVYEHAASYMPALLVWSGALSGWTHVAVVYQARQPRLYINGALVATGLTSTFANAHPGLRTSGGTVNNDGGLGGGRWGWFNGGVDEFRIYDGALDAAQVASIAVAAPRTCASCATLAHYRLEEGAWTGVAGEVLDSSGSSRHGQALGAPLPVPASVSPARAGSPGTCGYGDFNGGALTLPVAANTAAGAKTTVSFWMYWNGANSVMPIGWNRHDLWLVNGHFGFNTANSDVFGISSAGLANRWVHVSAVFTNGSVTGNKLYIDGVLQALTQRQSTPALGNAIVNANLRVSGWQANNGYRFRSRIDEVNVFDGEMTQSQVLAQFNATHPCGGAVIPANFNCVASGESASAGHLFTKIAGSGFSFDVVALKADGSQETGYASDADKSVTVELVDGSGSTACASRLPLSPAVSQTLTFVAADVGRKTAALMSVGKAYRNLRCRVTDSNQAPAVVGCSTDNFAVRPLAFTVASTNANADATGTNPVAVPIIKAGSAFDLTATALAGYDGTPAIDASKTQAHAGAVLTGALTGSFAAANPLGGTASGNNFLYDEVGYFRLDTNGVIDTGFTGVDVGSGDCTPDFSNSPVGGKFGCNFGNNAPTSYFGRFVPDRFVLTAGAVTAACTAGAPAFTYMNQPFQNLAATVQAQNVAGGVTANYHSPFSPATVAWQAENADNGTDLSARLNVAAPSPLWNSGVYSVSTAAASFLRATPDNPDGPFDSLQLGVRVTDPDAVVLNSLDMNAATVGACAPCNAKAVGAATSMRFGRLRLQNAHGSELRALPLTVRSEFWSGSGFAVNGSDGCAALAAGDFSLSNWQGNLNLGETALAAGGPWTAVGGLFSGPGLTVPGLNNQGSVDVTVDLAARPWLRGRWNDAADTDADANTMHDDDPVARATFGIYRDRLIYRREITR